MNGREKLSSQGNPVDRGTVFVVPGGVPIATIGDKTLCSGVPTTAAITSGSSIATINGRKVAQVGDACENGERLTQGMPWLMAGSKNRCAEDAHIRMHLTKGPCNPNRKLDSMMSLTVRASRDDRR